MKGFRKAQKDKKAGKKTKGGKLKANGKPGKRSQKKAPGAPKRGRSPYICFTMEKRLEIKASLPPTAKVTEIMQKIAEAWRALSDDEKIPWVEKAAADKARYEEEKLSYRGPLRVKNRRAKKNPDAPKRAMSGFLFFSQIRRSELKAEYPELKNTDISKLLGEEWKKMSDDIKNPFLNKGISDRERYREEMKGWTAKVAQAAAAQQQMYGNYNNNNGQMQQMMSQWTPEQQQYMMQQQMMMMHQMSDQDK